MTRRLLVDADLDMTVDGRPVTVRGDGPRVVVDVGDARTAWKVFGGRRPGRGVVRGLVDALERFGVDVEVVMAGRPLASVGPSAVSSGLVRAFGLDGVQVEGRAAVEAALSEPRVARAVVAAAFTVGFLAGLRR